MTLLVTAWLLGLTAAGIPSAIHPIRKKRSPIYLERLGVNIQGSDFRPNNVAAVIVTASLPPHLPVLVRGLTLMYPPLGTQKTLQVVRSL